jgi:hypothetical protein
MVADMRAEHPNSFVVLEADRARHDQIGFVKIPLDGDLAATSLRQWSGWPAAVEPPSIMLEIDAEGLPWLAMTDRDGTLYGGRLDGAIAVLLHSRTARALFPHVAALAKGASISAFNQDGTMFHASNVR